MVYPIRKTSPKPETATRFRYDPYADTPLSRIFYFNADEADSSSMPPAESAMAIPPPGTLHTALWGSVSFHPYPTATFEYPEDTVFPNPDEELVRCFVGQLPYFVTDMQLAWLCYTFGGRQTVLFPERILKRNNIEGNRLPTGCVHAYTSESALAIMESLMHKTLLIDDTGVWFCRNGDEFRQLNEYLLAMKMDRKLRFANRPYNSVVVQLAESKFMPWQPLGLNEAPPLHQRYRSATPPPSPPPYDSTLPSYNNSTDDLVTSVIPAHDISECAKSSVPTEHFA